jgi:hypothetical protein
VVEDYFAGFYHGTQLLRAPIGRGFFASGKFLYVVFAEKFLKEGALRGGG